MKTHCSIHIESFNTSNGSLQGRKVVNNASVTLRPLALRKAAAVLFKIKDLKQTKSRSTKNTTAIPATTSTSLLKIILYLSRPPQAKNYTVFSNFAIQGKLTIRCMGYQLMLSNAEMDFIVDTLQLLAPTQLAKHLKLHAPPPPLSSKTNAANREQHLHSTPTKDTSHRLKTSFSNRSPAAAAAPAAASPPAKTTLHPQKNQQDDRLAMPSPIPAPKPTKRTRPLNIFSSSASASSSTTAVTSLAAALPELSYDQEVAFNHFSQGTKLFVTGPGGTGKSVLIQACVDWCNEHHKRVSVTATTGVAACNVQGETIHSWSGISGQDIDRARAIYTTVSTAASSTSTASRLLTFDDNEQQRIALLEKYWKDIETEEKCGKYSKNDANEVGSKENTKNATGKTKVESSG